MSEKKGNTGKLIFDFNTAACLEVQLPNKNWYRITPNEFRSYTYPRRIFFNKNYQQYSGPVYLYGTNTIVENPENKGILYPNDVDPRILISEKRAYGRF